MHGWLKSFGIPIIHVATKSDQLSSAQRSSAMRSITATWRLVEEEKPCFVSAKTGEGKRELWARLDRLLREVVPDQLVLSLTAARSVAIFVPAPEEQIASRQKKEGAWIDEGGAG
jgi:50S ribosomal subunit-associated GTPase HflX